MARVANKVALVTGAGSGMGAAMAELFCREGAQVIAVDISGREQEVAAAIGPSCLPVRADISRQEDVAALLAEAEHRFGRLDILCNNAGILGPAVSAEDYPAAEFDRVIAINLRSMFILCQNALPLMRRAGGGSIVNTCSIGAQVAYPGLAGYAAAKAGAVMLSKQLAVEFARHGVRVNAILPGNVATGMTASIPADGLEAMAAAIPLGRIGTPMDIARMALFLASDEAAYVSGAAIPVDGGLTAIAPGAGVPR